LYSRAALDRAFESGVAECVNIVIDPTLMRRFSLGLRQS